MKLPLPPKAHSPFFRWLILALCGALLFAGPLPAQPPAAPAANTTAAAPTAASGNTTAAPAASNTTAALGPAVNTAIVPVPRTGNWRNMHNGFVDLAKAGNIDVLFLGDFHH